MFGNGLLIWIFVWICFMFGWVFCVFFIFLVVDIVGGLDFVDFWMGWMFGKVGFMVKIWRLFLFFIDDCNLNWFILWWCCDIVLNVFFSNMFMGNGVEKDFFIFGLKIKLFLFCFWLNFCGGIFDFFYLIFSDLWFFIYDGFVKDGLLFFDWRLKIIFLFW